MKKFPTAIEVSALKSEDLNLWMIEKELKEIKKSIFEAVHAGKNHVTRINMEKGTIDFLKTQGYTVIADEGFYVIYWNCWSNKLRERDIERKFATGGTINSNKNWDMMVNNTYDLTKFDWGREFNVITKLANELSVTKKFDDYKNLTC